MRCVFYNVEENASFLRKFTEGSDIQFVSIGNVSATTLVSFTTIN